MSVDDRRAHDPYAPPPVRDGTDPESAADEAVTGRSEPEPDQPADSGDAPTDELDGMRRAELVQLAEREGIASYGNRDALVARIRSKRSER